MWIIRAIRLGIARVLRLVMLLITTVYGIIVITLALVVVVLEGSNEV